MPLRTVIHPISLSFLSFSIRLYLFVCQPWVSWLGSRRDTVSGWGPCFATGFKRSSMGVVIGVEEVGGGGLCVCFKEGGHVEGVGKHRFSC